MFEAEKEMKIMVSVEDSLIFERKKLELDQG